VKKFSIIGYIFATVGLFLYSFTQIDLGLTLSRASVWQTAEKFFKNIGYFQRPLSSILFISIILLLFIFYMLILWLIRAQKISKKAVWSLIIAVTAILTFSYNAFSYDLFNYIFDAKIITFYHQNPYLHKALDFTGDPMLSFMHWTHRLFPYGPIWLGLTVPLSFIGLQFFLPTFFLFKILISASFLGTVYFIGKILQKTLVRDELFGMAFFALNPLVIVETLVSGHNDMVMMALAMWSLNLLLNTKYTRSIILLILSVGVKFATAAVLPVYAAIMFFQKKRELSWQRIFLLMVVFMIAPVILASFRTTFQPWYLMDIFPFAALAVGSSFIFIPSIIISLVAVFEYLPFLYTGNWNNPIPLILFWMTLGSIILSMLLVAIGFVRKMIK
jgi:hypothetical protein